GRARRAAEGSRIRRTKIGRAINGVKEANVGRVEEIEGLREDLQAASLLERKGSSQAKISGAEIVANEGVAGLDADTVVIAEDVSVRVKTGKLCETHGGLDCGNHASLEVASEDIPLLRRCHRAIKHETVANIVRRKSTLRAEVLAVLRVKSGHLGGWVRLIYVKEATEMDAADVETADAYCCIGERIEFDCSAGLNAIRVLMVLIEANHYGRSKKCTVSDRSTTRER